MSRIDVNQSLILEMAAVRPANGRRLGRRLLLWQPRLANAFYSLRHVRRMRDKPFDREIGIEATGFRQGGLRLVHLAFERISGGEHGGRYKWPITGFDW